MLRNIARNCSSLSPYRSNVANLFPRLVVVCIYILIECGWGCVVHRFRAVGGIVYLRKNRFLQRLCCFRREDTVFDQSGFEKRDRVAPALLFDLFPAAVGAIVVVGSVREET